MSRMIINFIFISFHYLIILNHKKELKVDKFMIGKSEMLHRSITETNKVMKCISDA